MKIITIADMALRETLRRRSVLVALLLLPLAFYLSRRTSHPGQAIRFLCLGLGWALSTAALFAGSAARHVEQRLRLSGYGVPHLYIGRLCALYAVGLAMSMPFLAVVLMDQRNLRFGAVALIMLLTVAVAGPFGLLISAVLPRDLEGTLVLLTVVGLQMMLDPGASTARVLPFWFSREIGTYAVDHTDAGYLHRGLLHALTVWAILFAAAGAAAAVRLRRRVHLRTV